jgi:hypothetical protein
MTTKERLHKLVNELSEVEADATLDFIASRREEENKPDDIIDEWGNLSATTRMAAARVMRDLAEDERAEFGNTIAEAWGYESPR